MLGMPIRHLSFLFPLLYVYFIFKIMHFCNTWMVLWGGGGVELGDRNTEGSSRDHLNICAPTLVTFILLSQFIIRLILEYVFLFQNTIQKEWE